MDDLWVIKNIWVHMLDYKYRVKLQAAGNDYHFIIWFAWRIPFYFRKQ